MTVTGDASETNPVTTTAEPLTYEPGAGCAICTVGAVRSTWTARAACVALPAASVATMCSVRSGPAPSGTPVARKDEPSTVAAVPLIETVTGDASATVPATAMLSADV